MDSSDNLRALQSLLTEQYCNPKSLQNIFAAQSFLPPCTKNDLLRIAHERFSKRDEVEPSDMVGVVRQSISLLRIACIQLFLEGRNPECWILGWTKEGNTQKFGWKRDEARMIDVKAQGDRMPEVFLPPKVSVRG